MRIFKVGDLVEVTDGISNSVIADGTEHKVLYAGFTEEGEHMIGVTFCQLEWRAERFILVKD